MMTLGELLAPAGPRWTLCAVANADGGIPLRFRFCQPRARAHAHAHALAPGLSSRGVPVHQRKSRMDLMKVRTAAGTTDF